MNLNLKNKSLARYAELTKKKKRKNQQGIDLCDIVRIRMNPKRADFTLVSVVPG